MNYETCHSLCSQLDGKKEAKKIINFLKHQVAKLKIKPCLATILIGKDPASQIYIKIKEKRAKEIGIHFEKYILLASVSEKKVLALINKLNKLNKIHGILVQLPLPKKFNTEKIINAINDKKDVDGFKTQKARKHRKHESTESTRALRPMMPPTIQAIWRLIKMSGIKLKSKKAVILTNSLDFAEPLKRELEKNEIKVDIILKPKLSTIQIIKLSNYQIIIIVLGKKHFLKPEMIKKNVVVIDVGINKVDKKVYGDVHPDCFKKSKYISPVPGGVGPLTVAFLLKNVIQLAKTKR